MFGSRHCHPVPTHSGIGPRTKGVNSQLIGAFTWPLTEDLLKYNLTGVGFCMPIMHSLERHNPCFATHAAV